MALASTRLAAEPVATALNLRIAGRHIPTPRQTGKVKHTQGPTARISSQETVGPSLGVAATGLGVVVPRASRVT